MSGTQHLPASTLRAYRDGRLPPAATLAASDHLALCPACREALADAGGGPSYDELAAAADGTLDLSDRLADDPAAAAELADLRAFKHEMAAQAGRVYGPSSGPSPQGAPRRVVTPVAGSWRARGRVLLSAAAAAALLLVGGWRWWHVPPASAGDGELLADRAGARADLALLPADLRAAVERTLRLGHPEPPPAADAALRPPGTTLAGPAAPPAGAFRALAPVGTVVREVRPTLRWVPHPDAARYVVTLARLDGTDDQSSPELPGTQSSWTVPAPLLPGETYRWQVEAVSADGDTLARAPAPPLPDARFRVLAAARRQEVASVEARFGRFPLVMAVAYTRAGLEDEARAQWAALAAEHPDSALARRWRGEAVGQSPSPTNTNGAQ